MDDIRQAIVSLDKNFKVLRTHYPDSSSVELRPLNEQIEQIERRWAKFIEDLEQCSTRVREFFFRRTKKPHFAEKFF